MQSNQANDQDVSFPIKPLPNLIWQRKKTDPEERALSENDEASGTDESTPKAEERPSKEGSLTDDSKDPTVRTWRTIVFHTDGEESLRSRKILSGGTSPLTSKRMFGRNRIPRLNRLLIIREARRSPIQINRAKGEDPITGKEKNKIGRIRRGRRTDPGKSSRNPESFPTKKPKLAPWKLAIYSKAKS